MIGSLRVRTPAGTAVEFSSPINFLCRFFSRYSFHPRVSAIARKRLRHSAKSAGGKFKLNSQTPLTQRNRSRLTMLSRQELWEPIRETLTRNSSENARPQSSQLAEPLCTDSWLENVKLVRVSTNVKTNKKT